MPQQHIPPSVMMEVSLLERSFDDALAQDCSSDRCFSKGCVYARHQTVDLPRNGSLPGLPQDQGIGSVPAQEYLTEARCEFTHERSVSARDMQALVNRLEQRLSRGWLKVVVAHTALEPINKGLAESNLPRSVDDEDKKDDGKGDKEPAVHPEPAPPPPPPAVEEWSASTAKLQLWKALLPHFAWMIAMGLFTLSVALIIWAARRLGAPSLEEKMLEAQLHNAPPAPIEPAPDPAADAKAADARRAENEEDKSFAEQQEKIWTERIAHVESDDDELVVELLREWLRAGDFPMLARALFVFGDRLSTSFTTDNDLALKKLEFAEYFREVDEGTLPSRAEFFRRLNQHAMSSLLLSQDDVQLYRALREDFGSSGIVGLMQALPPRFAALLFALVPRDSQLDVARLLPPNLRISTADQLLLSSRISKEESDFVFDCIGAARDGRTLPTPPKPQITDRGPSVDAAAALSVLLPHLSSQERTSLFARALQRSGGNAPRWFEDILFGEMLVRLPTELRNDLLLDVDIRGLAAWLALQDQEWQRAFVGQLSPSMQNAIRGNGQFSSRNEQMQLARRGHGDLIRALKTQYAKGRAHFVDLVADAPAPPVPPAAS